MAAVPVVGAAGLSGLDNLPFHAFDHNAAWLEISRIAQNLIAHTQLLARDGELAICEPQNALPSACDRIPRGLAPRQITGPAVDPVRLKGALPRRAGRVSA